MATSVELFCKNSEETGSVIGECNEVEKASRTEMDRLKSLDLDQQVSMFRGSRLAPIVSTAYEELSSQDARVWKKFLPRVYSKRSGDWKEYRFDLIPDVVIDAIAAAEGYFEDLEIWTPKDMQTDPLLVGVIGDKYFLIARWGESLLDFDQIIRQLSAAQTHWISFSKLAKPVQQFIVDRYRKNPEECFYIRSAFLSWHCWAPTQEVIVSLQGSRGRAVDGIAYFVCRKCGVFTEGKPPVFSGAM